MKSKLFKTTLIASAIALSTSLFAAEKPQVALLIKTLRKKTQLSN